ncbi:uncharacterized protein HKW66_Vig0103590 [Vigna angularis]|uniref:Uncharacterized protein n=2 Tax=Phaseolus angularis TaxID=3914 RepID=A0A8T0KKK0_PHAAN|nr:uncharacterized protein HKW66_Vig0103590 [Vigna angularis]BAT78712.1 hypothetical protein VIGAN_02143100 [Vigna angularis var. angularis]
MEGEKRKGTEGTEGRRPWHKPKEGSIFPKKRSSVKEMMGKKMKEVVVDIVKSTLNDASKKVSPAHEESETTHE